MVSCKIGKKLGHKSYSKKMSLNGIEISGNDISNAFADFFEKKEIAAALRCANVIFDFNTQIMTRDH